MGQTQKQKNGFMMQLATFIVDKRNLFLLITIILLVFSAFSRNWVEVENDQTAYLPALCETEQVLNVMSDQFTTYGTAEVMVANITYDEAEALRGQGRAERRLRRDERPLCPRFGALHRDV